MKRAFPLFLLVVLMGNIPFVMGNPDFETLWVDSYVDNRLGWTVSGSPPYIGDTTDYITSKVDVATEGDYGFDDLSSSGTISTVTLYFECKADDAPGDDGFYVYVFDGSSWTNEGLIQPSSTTYTYETLVITTKLNTDAKVNNAQIYFEYFKSKGADDVWIQRAYLYVDYTPLVGTDYTRDVTQGLSLSTDGFRTWSLERSLTQTMTMATLASRSWATSRTTTQEISLASDSSRTWSLSRALTQSLSFSSNAIADMFKTFQRTLTLGLSVASDSLRSWDLTRSLSQGMTIASDSLRGWTLSRTLTQSMSFISSAFAQLSSGGTEFLRSVALGMSVGVDSLRTWGLSRTITQGLSFTSNAIGQKLLGGLIQRFVSLNLKLTPIIAVSFKIIEEFDALLIPNLFAMIFTAGYFLVDEKKKIYFGGFAFMLWFFSAASELSGIVVNYELTFLYSAFALIMIIFILMDRAKNFGSYTDFWKG